jgi:type IV pilus assembly protein PilC
MDAYRFKAINQQGVFQTGIQDAANAADLETRLSRMGLDLISHRLKKQHGFGKKIHGIKRKDLINFSFHLEQLTSAGVPLIDALQDLGDSVENDGFQRVISQIVEGIESGSTFSAMLEQFPLIFGDVYTSMIRVGEHSGRMGEVLRDLAENIKWQDELASRVKRIVLYPAIVGGFMLAVILFVMVYLVPQLVAFVSGTGYKLPWYTVSLLATSDFFVDYWYSVVLAPIGIALAIKYSVRYSAGFHYRWDQFQLKVWLLGPVLYRFKLARFANYAAIMYASGIPLLDILQLSRKLVDNRVLDEALNNVHTRIEEGETIGNSFAGTGLFPLLVVRMVRVGETSGALDNSFNQVGYFYGREAREAIERFEQYIGPILMLSVGLILLWVVVSVYVPLISAAIDMV